MTAVPGRFIEAHILQTIPYANLNRDDTNSVKTVEFGGVNRTRISSQSWKRVMRLRLQQQVGEGALRTRRLAERIERHLTAEPHNWPQGLAARAGRHIVVASSVGAEPPSKEAGDAAWSSAAMVYVPDTAVAELAALAAEHRSALESAKDTKTLKQKDAVVPTDRVDAVLRSRNGVINLFGRMLAQVEDAKVDGAVQVAHAFTTHGTDTEIDYFSAVDDVTDGWGDSTGSAHMGHAEHSAGVLYRYVVLDLADLLHNLGGDTDDARRLAVAFLDAALLSMPAAKKNSTAPHTIPDLAHVCVRTDRPVSYASAFERPVRADMEGGYTRPSIEALETYAAAAGRLLGDSGTIYSAHASLEAKDLAALGRRVDSFEDLTSGAVQAALDNSAAETA
ncbi:type I-E CRISPR-associated protein Cas7/Cse4/CasC [Streptomyces sp. JJ36]|uniref:type I-E CRISPR-associated protein Cas7/Cse4/CasC n=1 Tax=Streptomyces sp. JJ36 TaxID=2736645 RepID=UPI001F001D2E|nr:type I-E CRISPR-associated protein Cas7/Cse4/CasC [Streptomyces sp. JJ36]MCF6523773.1 type I-E CRISPR-associated protein Cas7/Cse4/CasC [Streptomyces sp. JJ36]